MNTKSLLCYLLLITLLFVQLSNLLKSSNEQKVVTEMLQAYENLEAQLSKNIAKINDTGTIEFADGTILNCADKTLRYKNTVSYLAFDEMKIEEIKYVKLIDGSSQLTKYKAKNLYYLTVTYKNQRRENTEVYVLEET